MISALSGNSSLALLSLFGRSGQAGTGSATQAAQRPPPPPPPQSQGNGISAQSLFAALFADPSTSDSVASDAIFSLDGDGDGKVSTDELTKAYSDETVPLPGAQSVESLVQNILANLDGDGDGSIDASELSSGLQGLGHEAPPPEADFAQTLESQTQSGSQKSIQELLFSLLLDQNGGSGVKSTMASQLYG